MKHAAWLLAITGLAFNLHATSTLKPSETLDASKIADSVKKAAPKVTPALSPTTTPTVAPATPVIVRPPILPPVVPPVVPPAPAPSKDSAIAKRYKILNRPLNADEIKYFLDAFQMRDYGKPESSAVNWIWRSKQGGLMSYEVGSSEMGFANETVPMLSPKDYRPDSLIQSQSDQILKGILRGKAERYVFANFEITMVQKKTPDTKDAVQPPVPAFYYGRYLRKVDDRLILGDAFQIRIGYGEGGALQSFSFRDPVLADGGSIKVPTKQMIIDSLKRWERSKTHTRAYAYPFHPDHLNIRSLKPVKVFESYVTSQEKFREGSQMDGTYLLPSVTVLAEVLVSPSRKKMSVPAPEGPVLLHFHFPCRPASGLCWPDGNQDLDNAFLPPAKTSPAAPSTVPGTGSIAPAGSPKAIALSAPMSPAAAKPAIVPK